jgi:toxin ParE1/3/4
VAHVQWTEQANDAFAAIVLDRRQQVGFVAARLLRQRITQRVHLLRDFPEMGRLRAGSAEGRELVVPPYVIPYQIVGDVVFIIDIFHARASFPYDESESES